MLYRIALSALACVSHCGSNLEKAGTEMKTTALAILAFLTAAAAQAETNSGRSGAFDGAFVSAQFGAQSVAAAEANVQTTAQPGPSFAQPDAQGKGGALQIHGGYGHDLGRAFNLSVGGFVELGGADLDLSQATFFGDQVKQDISNRVGLYVAPGIYLDPQTLIYAKVGVSQATHNYSRATYGVDLSQQISGQMLGVGLKRMLSDRMFWTMDYTRVNYGLSQIGTSVPLNSFVVDVRSHAITEDISVGFGFQF